MLTRKTSMARKMRGPDDAPRRMRPALVLVGVAAVAVTIAACGPTTASSGVGSASAPGSISASSSAPNSPTSSSGAPSKPAMSPPNAGQQPTTAPGGVSSGGTMVPAPPYAEVPASQIDVVGMPTEQPTAVQTASGGRILMFHAEQSGCQQITAQVLSQSATQVVVDLVVDSTAGAGKMCPMIVRVVPVTAALKAPLGSRTLVFQETLKHG